VDLAGDRMARPVHAHADQTPEPVIEDRDVHQSRRTINQAGEPGGRLVSRNRRRPEHSQGGSHRDGMPARGARQHEHPRWTRFKVPVRTREPMSRSVAPRLRASRRVITRPCPWAQRLRARTISYCFIMFYVKRW
jgi:hypothetical protein